MGCCTVGVLTRRHNLKDVEHGPVIQAKGGATLALHYKNMCRFIAVKFVDLFHDSMGLVRVGVVNVSALSCTVMAMKRIYSNKKEIFLRLIS